MFKKIVLLFLLFSLHAVTASAQIYDQPCPNATQVLDGAQTINPQNYHLKAYLCVDALGNVNSPSFVTSQSIISVSRNSGAYPIVGDAVFDVDATYVAGSPTVTTSSVAPAFVSNAVPTQIAWGTFNCNPISEESCTNNCPQSTMTYVSAHVVTLSNNCVNNSSVTAHTNIFVWGTDDGKQLLNAAQAMFPGNVNNVTNQELDLPSGNFIFSTNPFVFIGITGTPRSAGLVIRGHNTLAIPAPNMNCNTGANSGCLLDMGFANNTLGNIGGSSAAYDISFWGNSSDKGASATFGNPAYGIYGHYGDAFYNVYVLGWVWNRALATPAYGWFLRGTGTFGSGDYAGGNFGAICQGFVGAPSVMNGGNWGAGEYNDLVVTGAVSDGGCNSVGVYFDQPQGPSASICTSYPVAVNAGVYRDFGSNGDVCVNGGNAYMSGTAFNFTSTWDCTRVQSGYLVLSGTICNGHAEQTGGTLVFAGGNHTDNSTAPYVNAASFATMTGGVQNLYGSVTGACNGTVPSGATSGGLYGTGTNITSTVCATIGNTVGAGIVMQQTGTVGLLQVNAGTAGLNASSGVFTVMLSHNGGAFATTGITCTLGTSPSCNDVLHYVSYAVGDLIMIQYTSQTGDTLANIKASVGTEF